MLPDTIFLEVATLQASVLGPGACERDSDGCPGSEITRRQTQVVVPCPAAGGGHGERARRSDPRDPADGEGVAAQCGTHRTRQVGLAARSSPGTHAPAGGVSPSAP